MGTKSPSTTTEPFTITETAMPHPLLISLAFPLPFHLLNALSSASPIAEPCRLGTALHFAPAAGTTWNKRLRVEETTELSEFRVFMNGGEVPSEFLPEMELDWKETTELVVQDTYVEMATGRPQRLKRSYETIERSMESSFQMPDQMPEPVQSSDEAETELEGRTVLFAWDENAAEYRAEWAEGEGPADLLAELSEDRDLRALLPEGDVQEGASWKVPAEALALLLDPTGDLSLSADGEHSSEWLIEYDEEQLSGEAVLTLGPTKTVGGLRVAEIEIEGEIAFEGTCPGDLSQTPVASGPATRVDTVTTQIEGRLSWNLEAGIVHSVALDSELRVESVTTKDGGEPDYSHTMVFRGRRSLVLDCEPVR